MVILLDLSDNGLLETVHLEDYRIDEDNPRNIIFSKLDYIATYAASGQHDTIDLSLMLDALEENGVKEFLECELTYVPNMEVELDSEGIEKVEKLVEALEDLDDVQDVYYNLKGE